MYLENIVMCPEVLIIAGDFNFHLDNPSDGDARKFNDLMETFGLAQHVKFPTHSSGHILDLVITRSSNDLDVLSPQVTLSISDHCFVECKVSLTCLSRNYSFASLSKLTWKPLKPTLLHQNYILHLRLTWMIW